MKPKVESARVKDRKEVLLFMSKREVLRPGWTTVATPKVPESVTGPFILEIIWDAIACGSSSGGPAGHWLEERGPYQSGETAKAREGLHSLLMN